MTSKEKITKKQLLDMINALEKNPEDKGRILGDIGITATGAILGAAAASTIAGSLGATSIFGVTTAASWLGVTAVAATPVGWVLGISALAGAGFFGISRLIHDGGMSEGRKKELLQQYKKGYKDIEAKEKAGSITDRDKTHFILSMKELIEKDVISPNKAKEMIEQVEKGRIPISQAFLLIEQLLQA